MAATIESSYSPAPPPVPAAKKVKHEMELFGDVRIDNYYWLRDDSRSSPEVLSYLQAENAYTDFIMSGTKHLEDQIYADMRGRIKEDDISAPVRRGAYYYYKRTLEGKEYVQHCRRLVSPVEALPSVYDTMPTGPDAPQEHVILDENTKAQEHTYYSIGAFKVSPNNKLVAYAEDTKGDEIYTVYIIDAETRTPVGKPLVRITSDLEWAGNEALLYITMDEVLRPDKVLGDFDASKYLTERKWANASDGTQIPLSIVYRKDLVKLDGSDPLLLYGYGSYEICIDPSFKASRLSLLDRGFIFAIAHIRGGGEMGRQWYENGKLLKKRNTFTDFIACAEYLIEMKFCSKEKLCIQGGSAGGLLIGAVLNMRPDLFKAAVTRVPFVDVVTTMLDPSIPLTTSEWEEWGDPRKEEFYFYMKSYSPVDNIKAQNYPKILVTAGLNDPRVMYSEPAKFVAKLRDMKMDDNVLLFKCELGAGHFSKSGRLYKSFCGVDGVFVLVLPGHGLVVFRVIGIFSSLLI